VHDALGGVVHAHQEDGMTAKKLSRRQLLKTAGVGAGALALGAMPAAAATGQALAGGGRTVLGGGIGGEALRLARVWPTTPAQWAAIWSFDDTHARFDDGSIELLLWPGDLPRLDNLGLRYRITVQDLIARDRALRESAPPPVASAVPGVGTTYRKLDAVNPTEADLGVTSFNDDMRLLADTYPDKVRMFELPEKSLEGRSIFGIEVCNDVAREDGRPVFYMDGLHHAREWPSGEFTIMFAYDLLENSASDSRMAALMDSVRTVLIPVQNPDGFTQSRDTVTSYVSAHTPADTPLAVSEFEYHRKNMRRHTSQPVETGAGIDTNRNYGLQWGGDGSSGTRTSQTYRGPLPFSEPESRNVRAILARLHAVTLNSNHTHGKLLLRPPGAKTFGFTPDEGLLTALGDAQAAHNGYRSMFSYQLYDTTGTTMDWGYGAHGSLAYTYEHGTSFHPNYSSYIANAWTSGGVRESFLVLAEAAADPDLHCVITGRVRDASGAPVAGAVELSKTFDIPLWKDGNASNPAGLPSISEDHASAMATDEDGAFAFHVNPSRRPYESGAGVPYTLKVTADGSTTSREVRINRGQVVDLGELDLT
jgi:hypothetical protein